MFRDVDGSRQDDKRGVFCDVFYNVFYSTV